MKADIRIVCKNDAVFTGVHYFIRSQFEAIRQGKEYKPFGDKKGRLILRKLADMRIQLLDFIIRMNKNFGEYIHDGSITLDIDFPEKKGGNVILHCSGTKEQIDEWTNKSLKDRAALKLMRSRFDIEVVKHD